ncbi:MAG: O-antigen ligase family protein [Candidatus Levybacteria bacterium]|nr:O-antigen ligase family protein [Candidatus Levybacteria bacterium]
MKIIRFADRVLEYSFYLLFLLIPLLFTNDTSELFEFNKMWGTFALTITIACAWVVKMIAQKRFYLQRTPLDIPILLFLSSQIISTIFSLDTHTSLWGYYSRFNGGLLSTVSYILVYYAFVSNFIGQGAKMVKKLLSLGLISGTIVALWGLPSHFGYDPTCFLFRGNFDVSCWTVDFQPKLRIFSTLGQPNWLAAYLAILMPLALAMTISNLKSQPRLNRGQISSKFSILKFLKNNLVASGYFLVAFLFLLAILYTKSQSGFLGLIAALLLFTSLPIYQEARKGKKFSNILKAKETKILLAPLLIFLLIVFFVGSPIEKLNQFTYQGLQEKSANEKTEDRSAQTSIPALELNITGSGEIRSIVWKGALDIFTHYPVFGSGVETFAYAYYKYRPMEHNITSEWNYLYNKAHNEYLNYLATTGILGLGSYLFMIGSFLYLTLKHLSSNIYNLKNNKSSIIDNKYYIYVALLAGYVSILVTNFFGFSVVVINIYFFLIPAFVLAALGLIDANSVMVYPKSSASEKIKLSNLQRFSVAAAAITALYLLLTLFRFWTADKAYYMGVNLDRGGQYQQAYSFLVNAVQDRGDEPVFQDELALNNAVLAASLISLRELRPATESAQDEPVINALLQNATALSDKVTAQHPNNIVFWKSRVRLFYSLSQVDETYLPKALDAIKKASALAPTDATISYNLGILEGQSGDIDAAIKTLENTVILRPSYRDARFGLALFYHQKAVNEKGRVIDEVMQQKAIEQMKYILSKIDPNDEQAKNALKSWNAE